ncbi:MAG: DUF2178 domain-containing protein [Candidatus Micrarchaeota archaeon]
MDEPARNMLKLGFGLIAIVLGLALNILGVGRTDFLFDSVGNWLMYIGFMTLVIVLLRKIVAKKKVVDERMEYVSAKAMRITFLALILISFVLMIVDGISPITMPYYMFLSYLICALLIVLLLSYKILLRFFY